MGDLGKYLKDLRKKLGYSLRQVEMYSGISNAYLSLLENSKRIEPHPRVLRQLAKVYDVDMVDMLKQAGYLDEQVDEVLLSEKREVEWLFDMALRTSLFVEYRPSKPIEDYEVRRLIAKLYYEWLGKTKFSEDYDRFIDKYSDFPTEGDILEDE